MSIRSGQGRDNVDRGDPVASADARLRDQPGYARFWASETVSTFGTYVSAVALPLVASFTIGATEFDFGLLTGTRYAPYLALGLLAGVIADRYRRRPILISMDLSRFLLLGLLAALVLAGSPNLYALMAFVAALGTLSLFYEAANQSYLPRLVPLTVLPQANARLQLSMFVAQTTGPLLGGSPPENRAARRDFVGVRAPHPGTLRANPARALPERWLEMFGWALAAIAVSGTAGWVMVAVSQVVVWFAIGLSSAHEPGYRQAVTPDRLQGRMNATIRSLNWGMLTIGAPVGGLLAQRLGYRGALWLAIAGIAAVALAATLSPLRNPRHPERQSVSES